MNQLSPNALVTEDGLVLKNVEKIEDVSTRLERRVDLDSYSWQICRMLRRDFNIASAKIFKLAANNRDRRYQIQELLLELTLQATEFEAESKKLGDPDQLAVRTLPLRIVSVQSATLFNAMRQADRAFARTNWAVQQNLLTYRGQDEMASGFMTTYSGIKHYLFGQSGDKTAGEMGKEMGIA